MKARIRKTGEIVDVIAYSQNVCREDTDNVSYIDSKGVEHPREKGKNYYWDFEPLEEQSKINWEQRRYEIAKAIIQGIRSNSFDMTMGEAAEYAVEQADVLIEELKKK